jgi:hypothetical protein
MGLEKHLLGLNVDRGWSLIDDSGNYQPIAIVNVRLHDGFGIQFE